jgi:putative transposase
MAEALGVSRSGFHAWQRRAPSDRQLADAWLLEQIKEIWAENKKVYGSPRVHAELRMAKGIRVGRKRVERLMREAQISGLVEKKRGRTTIRVPGVCVADDLVERDFTPAGPNQLWVADITYLRSWEGWLYLATVQDTYSRRIVGWSMTDHMCSELVVDALGMALARRRPEEGLIHHSDQGSQFVSLAFGQACGRAGIARSMARAVTAMTTPSPRAFSRHSRRNSSTASPSLPGPSCAPLSSSTSRSSTTRPADTRPSGCSLPSEFEKINQPTSMKTENN